MPVEPNDVEIYNIPVDDKVEGDVLESVMKLPEKYSVTIYSSYLEGYDSNEIGKLMDKLFFLYS